MPTPRDVQERLRALGFYKGPVDGDFGAKSSEAALTALQNVAALALQPRQSEGGTALEPDENRLTPAPTAIRAGGARQSTLFDAGSAKRLAAAHPLIQKVMNEARKSIAFTILDSQRGRAAQEKAFREGHSKAHFGQSAHNWSPAVAVDIAPVPLDWNNRQAFITLSKVILPIAKRLGVPLRWGGDWNQNGILTDEKLSDLPHYELHPWRDFAKDCAPFAG